MKGCMKYLVFFSLLFSFFVQAEFDILKDKLSVAIRNQNTQEALQILSKQDIDINEQGFNGRTYLHLALTLPEIIPTLLELGADPNIQDNRGATPFHFIAAIPKNMQLEVAQLFLDKGANPYIKTELNLNVINLLRGLFARAVHDQLADYIESEWKKKQF